MQIDSIELFTVSGQDSVEGLKKQQDVQAPGMKRVFLHFGVNTQEKTLRLEQYAWNEADFRIPDERGWKPVKESIIKELPFQTPLETNLPVEMINHSLTNIGHNVVVSNDPGRFVCNYVFMHSLYDAKKVDGDYSMFVHVPEFEFVSRESQLKFVRDLLDVIVEQMINMNN